MSRKLTLGGKAPQSGHKVSHSNVKTNRKWMPNIQTKLLYSETLDRSFRVTISTSALRSVDRKGGLDTFLLTASKDTLTPEMQRLAKQIRVRAA